MAAASGRDYLTALNYQRFDSDSQPRAISLSNLMILEYSASGVTTRTGPPTAFAGLSHGCLTGFAPLLLVALLILLLVSG